jgi:cell division protein FtsN
LAEKGLGITVLEREERMADSNQASRTFLAIVLGGIVLALVIAAYFMYGHKGETNVKVQLPQTQEQPAGTTPPAADTPAAEAPSSEPPAAEDEEPTEEPSEPPAEESMPPEGQPAETPHQN